MKAIAAALAERDFGVWILAARPLTLPLSATPVLVGALLALSRGSALDWLVLMVTLIAAIAIQIGTNLLNDAQDFEQGNDTLERSGPDRATAKGWLDGADVRLAAFACFAFAGMAGLYLVMQGGWPILLIGFLSLIAGYAYSAGPLPLSHTPLSELFVFIFFGIAAVVGTYFLQTGVIDRSALVLGAAMGSFAAAVLHTNNTRDRFEDKKAGRLTLAILVGARAWTIYLLFIVLPFALLAFLPDGPEKVLPLLALPFALFLVQKFARAKTGMEFNRLLVATIGQQLLYASLLGFGLLM